MRDHGSVVMLWMVFSTKANAEQVRCQVDGLLVLQAALAGCLSRSCGGLYAFFLDTLALEQEP